MANDDEYERVRAAQVDHIGVKLWQASHAFVALMMRQLADRGYRDLTPAHTALLPHLDIDGTRITALAARSGLTKQAIGQMVGELERRGYVTRSPDPQDGRAKIVRYTSKGLRFITDSQSIKRDLDTRCRRAISPRAFTELEASLDKLSTALDPDIAD